MDALFGFLSIVAFLVGALLLIIFLIMKRGVRTPLIVMAVAFAVFIVCVSSLGVENEPELENTDNTEMTETVITSYANQSIDLNNLGQYPWGNVLHDALLSIGATDIKTVKCEVDLSTVTFKIETETNKLWASVCGKYESEWYVEWIRNYDESDIYYYVTTRSTIYEERLYSYETGEIIYEPEPGNRSKYPIIVTVEEFVDEINADIESAKDKYNGKWVEITGRVTDYSRYNSSSLSGYYLYGEYGDEGLRIVCWQNKGAELQFTKVGCMCTCKGLVREITTANAIEIGDCRIVFE